MAQTRRERYTMPEDMREALDAAGLWEAYNSRPPYQRNDYIGWISRAKLAETKAKRLDQMLEELKAGDRYMNMAHRGRPSAGKAPV